MISFDEVFSSVKQYCREKGAIPDVAVKLWINALHPVRLDGNVALFTVQSSFQRDVILGNYGDLLKEAFLNTLGLAVDIQIQVVDEEDQEVQEKFKTNDYDEIARRHEELEHTFEGANYEYTFDTFIEAVPTNLPTLPAPLWRKNRARTTTPCSSMVRPDWERPT